MSSAPTRKDFEKALDWILWWAKQQGLYAVSVKAGNLHKLVGRYPDPQNQRMPQCCSVMRKRIGVGDVIVAQPPKGIGANLVICYHLEAPSTSSTFRVIKSATVAGNLKQPFSPENVFEACPKLNQSTVRTFLPKHSIGSDQPGIKYFTRASRGRYSII